MLDFKSQTAVKYSKAIYYLFLVILALSDWFDSIKLLKPRKYSLWQLNLYWNWEQLLQKKTYFLHAHFAFYNDVHNICKMYKCIYVKCVSALCWMETDVIYCRRKRGQVIKGRQCSKDESCFTSIFAKFNLKQLLSLRVLIFFFLHIYGVRWMGWR